MVFQKLFFAFLAALILFSGCLYQQSPANPGLCAKVSLESNRDLCFHTVAVSTGKEAYCYRILSMDVRDRCFIDLAAGNTWPTGLAVD